MTDKNLGKSIEAERKYIQILEELNSLNNSSFSESVINVQRILLATELLNNAILSLAKDTSYETTFYMRPNIPVTIQTTVKKVMKSPDYVP